MLYLLPLRRLNLRIQGQKYSLQHWDQERFLKTDQPSGCFLVLLRLKKSYFKDERDAFILVTASSGSPCEANISAGPIPFP